MCADSVVPLYCFDHTHYDVINRFYSVKRTCCRGHARSYSYGSAPWYDQYTTTTCPTHFYTTRFPYHCYVWNGDNVVIYYYSVISYLGHNWAVLNSEVSSVLIYGDASNSEMLYLCRTAPQLEPSQDPRRHMMGGANHGGLLPHPQPHMQVSRYTSGPCPIPNVQFLFFSLIPGHQPMY